MIKRLTYRSKLDGNYHLIEGSLVDGHNKLAAYENTGLSPEDILKIKGILQHSSNIQLSNSEDSVLYELLNVPTVRFLSDIEAGQSFRLCDMSLIKLETLDDGKVLCITEDGEFSHCFDTDKKLYHTDILNSSVFKQLKNRYVSYPEDDEFCTSLRELEIYPSPLKEKADGPTRGVKTFVGMLSVVQYLKYQDLIPNLLTSWWLCTPGFNLFGKPSDYLFSVNSQGTIYPEEYSKELFVRPTFVFDATQEVEVVDD